MEIGKENNAISNLLVVSGLVFSVQSIKMANTDTVYIHDGDV